MSIPIQQIPRAQKRTIARALYATLSARFRKGQPEHALDDFLPQLIDVAVRLNTADVRAQRIMAIVSADDEVDTYLRHIEGYLAIEALRRTGPNPAVAKRLHDAAFPDGLAHIDDRIVEENFYCRGSLAVLRAPENKAALASLELPLVWLDRWEEALDSSDAAVSDGLRASANEGAGAPAAQPSPNRDPEADWVRPDGAPAALHGEPRGPRRRHADRGRTDPAPAVVRRPAGPPRGRGRSPAATARVTRSADTVRRIALRRTCGEKR